MKKPVERILASSQMSDLIIARFQAAELSEIEQAMAREALLMATRPRMGFIGRLWHRFRSLRRDS